MPSKVILVYIFIVILGVFVGSGALWASNPELFVKVWRRIVIGDYYVQSEEWRQKTIGLQGRLCGFAFLCAGLYGCYLVLRMLRVV